MMNTQKYLFIDRDGTLIEEPAQQQIDEYAKLNLKPGVIAALSVLQQAGYSLVIVTNQDGLGTSAFTQESFQGPHELLMNILASQGIHFEAVKICPHYVDDGCECRKPRLGLVLDYISLDKFDRNHSYVIGDRASDMLLAKNMGISGICLGMQGSQTWADIVQIILNSQRRYSIERKTGETNIKIAINLDDDQTVAINTGIAFFDHMLSQLAVHGGFSIDASIQGDLHVDDHHTVEDTALVLGNAIKVALGDKRGIARYGFVLPMDESLAQVALDICNRAYFQFEGAFPREKVGDLSTECVPHFFRSFAYALGATLHLSILGDNAHHMVEALFKAMGRCLRQAIAKQGYSLPSSKGLL